LGDDENLITANAAASISNIGRVCRDHINRVLIRLIKNDEIIAKAVHFLKNQFHDADIRRFCVIAKPAIPSKGKIDYHGRMI